MLGVGRTLLLGGVIVGSLDLCFSNVAARADRSTRTAGSLSNEPRSTGSSRLGFICSSPEPPMPGIDFDAGPGCDFLVTSTYSGTSTSSPVHSAKIHESSKALRDMIDDTISSVSVRPSARDSSPIF